VGRTNQVVEKRRISRRLTLCSMPAVTAPRLCPEVHEMDGSAVRSVSPHDRRNGPLLSPWPVGEGGAVWGREDRDKNRTGGGVAKAYIVVTGHLTADNNGSSHSLTPWLFRFRSGSQSCAAVPSAVHVFSVATIVQWCVLLLCAGDRQEHASCQKTTRSAAHAPLHRTTPPLFPSQTERAPDHECTPKPPSLVLGATVPPLPRRSSSALSRPPCPNGWSDAPVEFL
jgi:hypothetical protein